MSINGIQVDIQAAIVIGTQFGTQIDFQHLFFVRANPGNDNYPIDDRNISSPCMNYPCKNDGFCVVLNDTSYDCLCTAGWAGRIINLKYFFIL